MSNPGQILKAAPEAQTNLRARPAGAEPIRGSAGLRAKLLRWFKSNGRSLPWRETTDPYAILVSEVMLQQTQVVTVLRYYHRWLTRFPDFAALAQATEAEVLSYWEGLGYYRRARNLLHTARLVHEAGGTFPSDPATIATLPGIGRYTAGAIATFAFGARAPVVEANIARVLARLLDLQVPIDSAAGIHRLWEEAYHLLPKTDARTFNSALMDLGALVCVPGPPLCPECPVQNYCRASEPARLPKKKAAPPPAALLEECAFMYRSGRVLLRLEGGPRWNGLWKLPPCPDRRPQGEPLLELVYGFTHHRVTLRVFNHKIARSTTEETRWFSDEEVARIAMPSPHRRALLRLLSSRAAQPPGDKTFAAPRRRN